MRGTVVDSAKSSETQISCFRTYTRRYNALNLKKYVEICSLYGNSFIL